MARAKATVDERADESLQRDYEETIKAEAERMAKGDAR